jgi:serine/threonine protein kinase
VSALPQHIGKYAVSGVIGRGGMGVVYRGTDPMLQRPVAIKVLHDPSLAEGEMQQRFLQEARAAANLRHENIVTIYEVGQQDGFTYVAMEYVSGETLDAVVRRGKSLPVRDVLGWIDQLCAGLALAHSRGIVHRDIKPANLVVDEHGALRILDFGIARVEGSTMTAAGDLIGTLHYMSPEQVHGQLIDYRSDIFAVGATAYELVTGQQAFPGNAAAAIQRILNTDPSPPSSIRSDLPVELDGIIARALAKDPARRFADLREMQRQIRSLQARLDTAETIIARPIAAPVAAAEATLIVKRPVPPTLAHETRPMPLTSVAEATPELPTPLKPSAQAETVVLQSPRWVSPLAIGGVVVAVAVIAGLLSSSLWTWSVSAPARPANDLVALTESAIAPHFDEEIRRDIESRYGAAAFESGLRVETTLDVELQREANEAVRKSVFLSGVEGALVAIDNRTGEIRAMVGGTAASQVNRATRPRRIGSLFLPVVAATAFDFGYTPVSILNDEPFSVSRSDGTWYSPVNDDGKYMGPITLRQVIEHSRNVAAMRLLESLAPQSVLRYAQRLGLRGNFRLGPELASGGPEATLVEVTSAYATIANKGVRVEPHSIKSVTRADGTVVEQELPQPQDGIREDTAFMTTYLLTGVVERGTGTAARSLNWTLPGMTGTVLDNGDAWFVGFDPDMTVGVWVGHDEVGPQRSDNVRSAAVSVWTDFMRQYIALRRDKSNPPGFNTPASVVLSPVGDEVVPFIRGTQPGGQPSTGSR